MPIHAPWEGAAGAALAVQEGRIRSKYVVENGDVCFLTRDALEREVFQSLALTSYVCVPIQAWNQTHGALLLLSTREGYHYSGADLDLCTELAARLAQRIAVTA